MQELGGAGGDGEGNIIRSEKQTHLQCIYCAPPYRCGFPSNSILAQLNYFSDGFGGCIYGGVSLRSERAAWPVKMRAFPCRPHVFARSTFENCSALQGGAIYLDSDAAIVQCSFSRSVMCCCRRVELYRRLCLVQVPWKSQWWGSVLGSPSQRLHVTLRRMLLQPRSAAELCESRDPLLARRRPLHA